MPRTTDYPKTVKNGSVAVQIYRVRHKTMASGFAYVVAWKAGGRRQLKQFAAEAEALDEGRLKAAQLAAGRVEGAEMGRADRDELLEARRLAGDVPVLAALDEWRKARELAGGQLIAAAEGWAARNGVGVETVTVKEAISFFLKAKSRQGVDVAASYNRILPSLEKALGAHAIGSLSARQLTAWLENRYPHPVSRNTARKRLVTLWRWARKQGYLPREALTEAEQTETAREASIPIGVITAPVYAKLLEYFRANEPGLLGALALAGFCGLRRAEIHAQIWEDINLERGFVRITAAKRNTPSRRLTPLCPAAVEWLRLCPDRSGEVCEGLGLDRIRKIGREREFVLPENCFRHSFISHRVAQTGNVAETALEAGNSPQIVFKHYRELFTKEDGAAWFSIRPAAAV